MEKLAIDTNSDSVYTNNSLLTDNLEFFEITSSFTSVTASDYLMLVSVRYNTCMLKKEKRKKIYESKANEIVRERSKEDIDDNWKNFYKIQRNERFDEECAGITKAKNEAYNLMIQKKRDARNEEKRIHRAKKRKSMMTQMEPIQKYSTKHLSREIFRTMNDNRRAFISRTKNFISKMDEIINQVDKDNVFDELDDTDSYKI
ncbi:hypothetical protein CWI38_0285p0030 [Hamiltosporidium tvaerminnensis]|uniref:Uncharacterized protein n=1 Tax=Hamiltosporidium tvaerminnensis TaxID=1176355 RepID=A0A4Q9LYQ3_9MICR|nr:hypothetical protein CWI38_0285p0030 [Hamiltosporidium tvaerminnensis]